MSPTDNNENLMLEHLGYGEPESIQGSQEDCDLITSLGGFLIKNEMWLK